VRISPKTVAEINAFLPPAFEQSVLERFEAEYGALFKRDYFTICMVGWFEDYKGEDLYGFDTMLQAIAELKAAGNLKISLVASINGVKSQRVADWIDRFIREHSLHDQVEFIEAELEEVWPLYVASDLFVRPSRSDGSALSVLEADWFETPVIASDCVPRPQQVTTFATGDATSLSEAISEVMDTPRQTIAEKCAKIMKKRFRYDLFTHIYGVDSEA